ncbi:MAG: hypothetical protein O9350_12645 [Microcystis sp. LE19-388.1G]|nr:hypothetical protein [Microcystis sp. LE19-388.1G]
MWKWEVGKWGISTKTLKPHHPITPSPHHPKTPSPHHQTIDFFNKPY